MVVLLHATNYGIRNLSIDVTSPINVVVAMLKAFSMVAVNCFVLVTGYYSSESNRINYNKLMSLWRQVFTYSVGVYLVLVCFTDTVTFDVKMLIKMALPLFTNQYWFFTVYILLMLISPYINVFVRSVDQKTYIELLIGTIILFSIVPSINIFGDTFGTQYGYSLIWFVVLYISAAYIRRFEVKKRSYGLYYIIIGCIVCIAQLLMKYAQSRKYPGVVTTILNLQVQYNSPLVFAAAICLFLFALNHPLNLGGWERLFGKVASMSFAVYLFHENGAIRNLLWNQWICLENVGDQVFYFTVRIVVSSMLIFTVGIMIEWIRRTISNMLVRVLLKYRCKE